MTTSTYTVAGMTCGHCVMSVKKALQGVDGVQVEQVSIGSATVAFDPQATSAERIAQAVTDAGYEVASAA